MVEGTPKAFRDADLDWDLRPEEGAVEALPEPGLQRPLTVVSGPTEQDRTHEYLRIVEVSVPEDQQPSERDGVLEGDDVSQHPREPCAERRGRTWSTEDVLLAVVTHSAQRGSYGYPLAMNLFRRVGIG